ncbi:TetR/AcrR family transcriptional regulator [Serratia sp. AKBS12]|uniref:TetR/AcrR family transcriptional regulator n=1 Tax=Serratia sp. AKBS12 TaxID=2974597 RepID=UPI0021658504|nr:TetR/AcrR family transcriptional regulator [Serratia sp. AKBS12]MCS3407883.1 TetR/AcrR family transcriptional regulator [Serratia sp. AKBS12]HEI8866423.1 TetR/AcrR family transcriptional regulator [Serratia odorifera]
MTTSGKTSAARQRILLTAHELFYRDGIRATGIDRIINAAGVTKVTFYRHFASKNALIEAFLIYRHQQWLAWFRHTLAQQVTKRGDLFRALPPCLETWFNDAGFRGCAFINSAVELADLLPTSIEIAQAHKRQMSEEIARYLPADNRQQRAAIIAMLVDGAIVKVQIEQQAQAALLTLAETLSALSLAWRAQ